MIVFDLSCDFGHRFEGWFGSSSDFADQMDRGLVTCPECGSSEVIKAPMAPAVPAKGNRSDNIARATSGDEAQPVANRPMPEEVQKALRLVVNASRRNRHSGGARVEVRGHLPVHLGGTCDVEAGSRSLAGEGVGRERRLVSVPVLLVYHAREPEIADLDVARSGQQNVGWL